MAISILVGIDTDDLALGFDQEPGELVATLLAIAGSFHDVDIRDERANFLEVFGEEALLHNPEAQTTLHEFLNDLAAAVEGRVL